MHDRADIDAIDAALSDCRVVVEVLGLDTGGRRPRRESADVMCLWHSESDPSMRLALKGERLVFCCYACQAKGDLYTLVAQVCGLDQVRDFGAVKARAAELARVDIATADRPRAQRPSSSRPPPLDDGRFAAIMAPLVHLGRLDDSPLATEVTAYLDGRGILAGALADGWAALPRPEVQAAWIAMLLETAAPCARPDEREEQLYLEHERAGMNGSLDGGGMPTTSDGGRYAPPFTADELRRSGLVDRGGLTFAAPANRVVIPWRDPGGRIYNVQRRRIDSGEPRYLGVTGRSFPWPYGIERMGCSPADAPIAWVEGAIDTLAARRLYSMYGEQTVVLGLPGLGGWRSDWATLARGRVSFIALDSEPEPSDAERVELVQRGRPSTREIVERTAARMSCDLYGAGALEVHRRAPKGVKDWAEVVEVLA